MLVGVSSDPSLGAVGQSYDWPFLPSAALPDGRRDMRQVPPPDALVFGGHWATDLREGWLALTDTASRRGLVIVFPADVFRVAWLWQVYGGWRGHYHLALEPWTGYPMRLDEAIAAGAARILGAGETLQAEVAFVVYEGRTSVERVTREGGRFEVG
jgi:hypothetical protein